MVFDPGLGKLVLFGGFDYQVGFFADTWTWDGIAWTELHPPSSPSARYAAHLAFDRSSQTLILFGGYGGGGVLGDTWSWDGSTWTEEHPRHSPMPRSGYGMDTVGRHVVLFGGAAPAGFYGDTWVWQGDTWIRLQAPISPRPRTGVALALDPAHHEVLIFGGYSRKDGLQGHVLDDTWVLRNGTLDR